MNGRRFLKPSNVKDLYPRFFSIAQGLAAHIVDFGQGNSGDGDFSPEERPMTDLKFANAISSRVVDTPNSFTALEFHKPVLDIDHRCLVLDSSTPGHHHLIIDVEIPWDKYKKLLEVLSECQIIEPGYMNASIERKGSYIRVPWVKKDDPENGLREDDDFESNIPF